ncbi:MAG: hypothetical protein C4290_02815 [Chloroflexota bacterium]
MPWTISNRLRTLAVAGILAAAGLGGATVAAVHAQQPTPTPAATQQRAQRADEFLSRLAQNLGVTPERLRDAIKQTVLQEVDAAVARGDLTAQQAQAIKDRINAGELGPFGFGVGLGRGRGKPGPLATHADIAQFLGITPEQLRAELNGQSLAQVAQAHGKSRDQLIQFLVSNAEQRLTEAVQAGRLTQQQADQRLAGLRARIAQLVDQVHQPRQPRQGSSSTTP